MQTIKITIGAACLILALYLSLVVFWDLELGHKIHTHLTAKALLAICIFWLGVNASFLIIRRAWPATKNARLFLKLSFWLCFGFVVFAGVPSFVRLRATSSFNACLNTLRQIDGAANQFALEHHLTNGSPINFPDDLTPYIKLNSAGKIPECPQGGIYHIGKIGETPTCSLGNTVTPSHVLPLGWTGEKPKPCFLQLHSRLINTRLQPGGWAGGKI